MKRIGMFPSMVIFATLVLTLATYPLLPSEVAVHFGTDFSPDMFVQKWLGLILIPFLMVMFTGTEYYGKEKVKPDNRLEFEYMFYALLILLAIIQVTIILFSLGYEIPTGRYSLLLVGALLVLTAMYLSNSKKIFLWLTLIGFKKIDARSRNSLRKITVITLSVVGFTFLLLGIFMFNDPSIIMLAALLSMTIIIVGSGVYLNKK
ncbi:hypothetical protein BMT55_09510 [Listeria newyorkensis]|uniref:SdpI family protein n=1 Tax=Listeria newyorkensis TaxID=1497681 RepID=A0A841YVH4_9LIST|nr:MULTISPECIES: DUF1648 domain-containing protein [Listeria]KGL46876.1 membrane protein [Listeriaceae bacterium FSL A5-0209]KGL39252.1 membrane protein [Listeria newyorkensis]KMT58129.1 hypothetical protein X559_3088 [Listeria newyorkensis]MBC1456972.1 SdpI family protein [Listeria newyorkensis]PNP91934.1 hypothetical protein BMT55_09510 [Listeria newyorkensis]